jgi:hypothetical protein
MSSLFLSVTQRLADYVHELQPQSLKKYGNGKLGVLKVNQMSDILDRFLYM